MSLLDELFNDPIFQVDQLIKEAKALRNNLEKIERETMQKPLLNKNSFLYFNDALERLLTELAFTVYEDRDQIFQQASEGLTGDMVDEMSDNAYDIIKYHYVQELLKGKHENQ